MFSVADGEKKKERLRLLALMKDKPQGEIYWASLCLLMDKQTALQQTHPIHCT